MKRFLSTITFLGLAAFAHASAPVDLGTPTGNTPYDSYMAPVKHVLNQLDAEETSFERVRELMNTGRNFRYSFTAPYVAATPAQTAAARAGDCKAKALWLADQLKDSSIRFVIGKARSTSKISHAWLMWQHDSRWWILDCTNLREPIPADRVSPREYIPLYSYAKNGEFRHHATQLFAEGIATRSNVPVGARRGAK